MEWAFSILLGFGLSAATGFRIFVPFFCVSLAAYNHWFVLPENISWMASLPALIAFGTATAVEIGAYYIPWVDNLLDTISTPAAAIAGALMMGSFMTDINPLAKWMLAIIAGGGTAGVISAGTATLRAASSAMTVGTGNSVVATGEMAGSTVMAFLAIFIPIVAAILVVVLLFLSVRFIYRKLRRIRQ